VAIVGGGFVLLFLLFFGVMVVGTVFWIWCLIDVLRRPDQEYVAAGQNKIVWLLLVLFVHLIGGLLYLFIARPQLERVAQYRY
jgi:hypothetical protein